MAERHPYRVFVELFTRGAPPWRVEFAGQTADVHEVVIEGVCRSDLQFGRPKPYSIAGTGVVTIDGTRAVITESEA